jgi:DNA-binding MarR family transcriptional regulator
MGNGTHRTADRLRLEQLIGADLRSLTSESDWIARTFAERNNVSANEFRALLFVMIAETNGVRLTAGDLRRQMSEVGHLRRETDPSDRRKVILRYGEHGMEVARTFFSRLAQHNHGAMAELPDSDLEAAHRTFDAVVGAMRGFRAELVSPGGSQSPA